MDDERFDPAALTKAAEDTLTVRRVFGEAYERDGVLVIPVARVMGLLGLGAGGGKGSGLSMTGHGRHPGAADAPPAGGDGAEPVGEGEGHGGGGGYGARVKPLGVYVVDPSGVHWQPAVDWNRLVLGGQLLGAWALTLGAVVWAASRRRR